MVEWDYKNRPDVFRNIPPAEDTDRISALIEHYRPQVVITYDDKGLYQHPDHVYASQMTQAAVAQTGIPAKLYLSTIRGSSWSKLRDALREAGVDVPDMELTDAQREQVAATEAAITTTVDIRPMLSRKREALMAHVSQIQESWFAKLRPNWPRRPSASSPSSGPATPRAPPSPRPTCSPAALTQGLAPGGFGQWPHRNDEIRPSSRRGSSASDAISPSSPSFLGWRATQRTDRPARFSARWIDRPIPPAPRMTRSRRSAAKAVSSPPAAAIDAGRVDSRTRVMGAAARSAPHPRRPQHRYHRPIRHQLFTPQFPSPLKVTSAARQQH